jgi:Metallo-peptidase family M12
MINARAVRASLLLASFGLLAAGPALTQTQPERVPLIMTKLPPQNSALYKRIIKHAGKARGQVLTLTKTEMWEVPKENVDAVKKAAAEHGASATQLGTDWNHVFHKAPADMTMNEKQKTMMENAKSSKSTMGVGMMASPMAPMVEYALTKDAGPNIGGPATSKDAARITIKLSDKTELTIVRTNVDIKPDMCVWRGAVEGTDAPATIMWWPGGKMAGTLQHEGKIYSIRHMGGEMHAVVEMGEDRMPQEHAPMPERMRANDPNLRDDPLLNEGDASIMKPKRQQKGGQLKGKRQQQAKLQQAKTTADQKVAAVSVADPTTKKAAAKASPAPKDIVIDVIVAYTKKAAGNYTDVKRELVDLSIEEANESFRRSGVGQVKLKLVHAYQTDYVEEGGAHFDHVWRFADKGDGYMDEIHGLRDKYRADVAILIVDDPKGCGLATRVFADAEEAFAVVHHECAAASYSLAHEIGHLIGARHDLNLDKNMNPFSYGHGFVNGNKWRDIMSYKDSCGGCPRLPVWSSPLIQVKGETAGTAELNNARVIAEQAGRVAAFR